LPRKIKEDPSRSKPVTMKLQNKKATEVTRKVKKRIVQKRENGNN